MNVDFDKIRIRNNGRAVTNLRKIFLQVARITLGGVNKKLRAVHELYFIRFRFDIGF